MPCLHWCLTAATSVEATEITRQSLVPARDILVLTMRSQVIRTSQLLLTVQTSFPYSSIAIGDWVKGVISHLPCLDMYRNLEELYSKMISLNFSGRSGISIHHCLVRGGHEKSSPASNALALLGESLLFQQRQILSPLSEGW